MTVGAYLLDLINENDNSIFNLLILGEECEQDVSIAEKFFPCCNIISAALIDEDINQLREMNVLYEYIVITYFLDKKIMDDLSKLKSLLKDDGQIIIVCPNSNNINRIAELMKYRIPKATLPSSESVFDFCMDISDRASDLNLIIYKFGLFGEPIKSQLSRDELIRSFGDDYADAINALFLPYVRISLKNTNGYTDSISIFSNGSKDLKGYIHEVNTFNIYNLILRKTNQDYDFYMKNLDPVKHEVKFDETANEVLKNKINAGKPFCALRLGNTEGTLIDNYINNILEGKKEYSKFGLDYAFTTGGFFVSDFDNPELILKSVDEFVKLQLEGFKNADIMMMWGACRIETVIANHFASSECENISYFSLIPYIEKYEPWTMALKGKKVLVVTSTPDSVEYQYSRKELISPYKNSILPDFTLITYKMIQTCQEDNKGFASWFDALEHVKNDILSIDFDVAIVGAGFYGVPLCDAIKKSGRSAIEMCGLTSFLFGVAGKRFIEDQKDFYGKFMTDAWIRPFDEKPSWYSKVEGGCYW